MDPAADLPGGPFAGMVMIGSDTVEVTDLVVESGGLAELSSNTLRMQIAGLGGGGHLLEVGGDAQAAALPAPGSVHCLEDDLQASLVIESFEVVVHSPLPGEVVALVPTPVSGEVRHGREIAGLSVNGLALDVGGQTFEPGVGPAGTFVLPFDTELGQTDFLADIMGLTTSVATFDPGSNRLVVEARDDRGTRAFASHIFAVGDVLPLPSFAAAARVAAGPPDTASIALHEGTEVADALVVGLVPDAVRRIFERYCSDGEDDFEELLAPASTTS